jgi:hypothetical protein
VLCGACRTELSIRQYLTRQMVCPACIGIMLAPYKTESPLIVDPDAVLSSTVSSSWLPGGTRKSFKVCALFNIVSLRRATFSMFLNRAQR